MSEEFAWIDTVADMCVTGYLQGRLDTLEAILEAMDLSKSQSVKLNDLVDLRDKILCTNTNALKINFKKTLHEFLEMKRRNGKTTSL